MSFLDLKHTIEMIDFYPGGQHKTESFRKINPLGQLPIIEDDKFILRDAQAILVYLASKYDASGKWYPRDDAEKLGQIVQWLSFADGLTNTSSAARLHDALCYTHIDIEAARAGAHQLFHVLDDIFISLRSWETHGSAQATTQLSQM